MALTPLPDPPQTSDPANFATKADALVAALAVMVAEINAGGLTLTAGTLSSSPLDASVSTFNLLATPTTVNAFAGASVALNIGNASAAAAFPGGISIPTGKTLSGAGAIAMTGSVTGAGVISSGDTMRITSTFSPASGGTGNAGTMCWDASYFYVCTASGAWKRIALTGGY